MHIFTLMLKLLSCIRLLPHLSLCLLLLLSFSKTFMIYNYFQILVMANSSCSPIQWQNFCNFPHQSLIKDLRSNWPKPTHIWATGGYSWSSKDAALHFSMFPHPNTQLKDFIIMKLCRNHYEPISTNMLKLYRDETFEIPLRSRHFTWQLTCQKNLNWI